MKNIKKIICIILSLIICFSFSLNILASQINETTSLKIINALNAVEFVKDNMGLSDINFEDIEISDPIHTYEYTSNGFIESRLMYPLKVNNTLIALAVAVDISTNTEYQISTTLVSEINSFITEQTNFALVYDYDCCYLFDGTDFNLLKQNTMCIEERAVLQTTSNLSNSNIELTNITSSTNLGYVSAPQTRAPIYYACSVDYVTQKPYDYLCWAACVACISNYVNDTSLTAKKVAKAYYGDDFNYPLPNQSIQSLMREYDLKYTYKAEIIGDAVMYKNIRSDYPIFALFAYSYSGRHAVVIYGINITASYIYFMDPMDGFCSATYDAAIGYNYVSPSSNDTLVLYEACARYWTA